MDNKTTGWIMFIAAIGMMCGLLSVDIAKLMDWNDIAKPEFVGLFMAHLAAVITAFIGGKIIPADRNPGDRTRSDDK